MFLESKVFICFGCVGAVNVYVVNDKVLYSDGV